MEDWLIDDDRLPLERKSVLPGRGFFEPDTVEEQKAEHDAAEKLTDADRVVIADGDADGLACAALIRLARGDAALLPAGPHEIRESLAWVGEYGTSETDVYICDLCPDDERDIEPLEAVVEGDGTVTWYDHHQWDEDLRDTVESAGVDLVVGDSDEVCTADVALSALEYEFEERHAELALVTRDHDLWIREDARSDDLADFSHWAEPEEYVETVLEHGADLPPEVQAFLAEQRVEKEALIEKAVQRAQIREIGPWTVGITYGRCSQNEVAEALRQQGTHAAVIVKPSGAASIRGTEEFERCHEVAAQVNGGGHPRAAGCKPPVYDDMLDYAHHWTTQGAVAKRAIIEAFRRLAHSDDEQQPQ